MKVCIDAGHCELTSGKRSFDNSFYEYEFNLDIANRIKKHLDRHGIDCYVQQIVDKNSKRELNTRIKNINKEKPTLTISIHANAFGNSLNSANGWEIYCFDANNLSQEGTKLAMAIHSFSIPILGLTDRGIKDAHGVSGLVLKTTCPTVLVEHGFYTNVEELAKLKDNTFRELCAIADTKGVLRYLGITWKGEDMKEHWGKKYLDSLVAKGLINSPQNHKDLDAPISKAEIFSILDKITDK